MTIEPRNIQTKAQFLTFMGELSADLKEAPETFENTTLEDFLKALAAWVADSDGYYRNIGENAPPPEFWRYLAEALSGASVYK